MNKQIDLDIQNYNLHDILELFKIEKTNFDEADLKMAKQIVLKTHPDKCNLPSEYFIFFSKAYKTLFSIWEFRQKGNKTNQNTEYLTLDMNEEEQKKLLNNFFDSNKNLKKANQFNKWFNKEFEKNKIHLENEEKGYGDWLKTNDDNEEVKVTNMSMMAEEFERKKSKARALVLHKDIQEISYNNGYNLSVEAPSSFTSDMFSSLPYQDLHQAHTETIIPVTEEDFKLKQKFNTVNEFQSFRNNQDTKPLSEQQALNYLKNRTRSDEENAVKRAYDLARQTEEAQRRQQSFWSNIQLLQNK
jgi:hypothetical protein